MDATVPPFVVVPIRPTDLDRVLALNNAAVPHVDEVSPAKLTRLVATCAMALVARLDGAPAGFLIAFGPGASYESPNYRWFAARFPDFLYVDRIAIGESMRGAGLGRALYRAVFDAAGDRPVCCEVNLRPPNPDSLAFHARIGLFEIGRQELDGGRKEVAMLANRPLPS